MISYLDQGVMWQSRGRGLLLISQMDPIHRHLASRWLERGARHLAVVESYASSTTIENPIEWIRATPLYRALRDGLTAETERRSAHHPSCPRRHDTEGQCNCHRSWCPAIQDGEGACTCRELDASV